MFDTHLGEHLDKVSAIVVKKYSFPFYSRASTFVREWYLSGRRFSYFDWTNASRISTATSTPLSTPSSIFSKAYHSSSASSMAPSSYDLVSSSPPRSMDHISSSDESDSCEEDEEEDDDDAEEEEDDDEPLTPNTPLPPYSALEMLNPEPMPELRQRDIYHQQHSMVVELEGKENLPRSTSKGSLTGSNGSSGCRPPLNRTSWKLNQSSTA
jgi:hypothetical protein